MKEDFNDIFNNYDKVKQYMLPEETRAVLTQKQIQAFLGKHVLFEYVNFHLNTEFYLEQNFAEFTEKMMSSYNKKDIIWNLFKAQNIDISSFDRESATIVKS